VTLAKNDIYYDPYDFEIDADPYPVWRRMRNESPLYYNEKYDFYALSRFEDVERASLDWATYRSGRGSVLELIKSGRPMPAGVILFEDPPIHDLHRSLMSRVFTPKKMAAIEPEVRAFCARTLDPLVGHKGFDFVQDLGVYVPMRTIGYLLGIPESDQEALRAKIDAGLRLADGVPGEDRIDMLTNAEEMYAEYIDWRSKHPSNDLMTALLTVEFEDETGVRRRLSREEVLTYTNMLSSAGNETTARLIGWTGKLLAEHPQAREQIAADRSLIPNAIEETLRYEAPSPIQARYVAKDAELYGHLVPEGSVMVLLTGSANRDERRFSHPDNFDIHRSIGHHLSFGYSLHFCLGAALARLEARVALDEVLNRWTDWQVDYPNAVQGRTSTVRGWERLPVLVN
jgi:cytochrome P450